MAGEQDDALFDLGEFFFQVIDMGTLDIVHDKGDGKGIKFPGVENLFLEDP
jgi:hypothetical protein